MIDLLAGFLDGLADVGRRLGPGGLVMAVAVAGAVWLLVRCADATFKVVGRAAGGWSRLPVGVRQLAVAAVAWFLVWRYLVPRITWSMLAVALLGYGAYWLAAQRLRLEGEVNRSNFEVWARWLQSTSRARAHDGAVRSALGKDQAAKVVASVTLGDVERVTYRPPDGMNVRALADRLREGDVDSAVGRRCGEGRCVRATPMTDGTVVADFDRRPPTPPADLTEVEWWTP